jgi:simple sugar transport system ATP-binding protein
VALVAGMTLSENLSLRNFRRKGFSRGPFLDRERLGTAARETIERFGIIPSDPEALVEVLSGGNLQKTVLARELEGHPRLIIAQAPTAGLDIAMVDVIHRELIDRAAAGAAILVVSEDLDELLAICHRIVVLFEGRQVGEFEASDENRGAIGLAMSGLSGDRNGAAAREAS